MMKEENTPKTYQGKEYTAYEAKQRQRQLETTMRAQRQKIGLLEEGGVAEDDIIDARARYRVTSQEYTGLSKAMGIPQQRERVRVDGIKLNQVGKNAIIKDTKSKGNLYERFPSSQAEIDKVLGEELKNVRLSGPVIYNPRLRCQGKTISTLYPWGETKSQIIEIGKQVKPGGTELIDTILHEEMEARIVKRSYRSEKYKRIDRGGEKTTHPYLIPIVERFIRMKGL